MPLPQSGLYLDRLLSGVAAERPFNDYIAEFMAPVATSIKQTAKIARIDAADDIHRAKSSVRPAGAMPNFVSQTADTSMTVTCNDHALADVVTVEEAAQAEAETQPAIDCVTNLVERLRLGQEIEFKAALDAGVAATDITAATTPSTKWDDEDSTPISDIKAAIIAARDAGAVVMTGMAIDYEIYLHLINHPDIQARISSLIAPGQTTGNLDAGRKVLAEILGLNEIAVAKISRKNTAGMGTDTPSYSNIWGTDAWLYYAEPPKLRTANAALTVVWNLPSGGDYARGGGVVDGWSVYMQDGGLRKATEIMVSRYYDFKIINPKAIVKIPTVIS